MTGLLVIAVVLVATVAFALWRLRTDGRLTAARSRRVGPVITAADIGQPLAERATFVQFSSAFCAPCKAARHVLAHAATGTAGVGYAEVDAASRLDLVRRLGITRTPTTFVVDGDGRVLRRSVGVPRLADVQRLIHELTKY